MNCLTRAQERHWRPTDSVSGQIPERTYPNLPTRGLFLRESLTCVLKPPLSLCPWPPTSRVSLMSVLYPPPLCDR